MTCDGPDRRAVQAPCLYASDRSSPPAPLQVEELLQLQSKSRDGVITLSTAAFDRFTAGKSRSYSLFLIGDARQFRRQGRLKLEDLLKSFAAVARAFRAAHAGERTERKAFFATVVFEDAREVFNRLGVKGLPYLSHIPPTLAVKPSAPLNLPSGEELRAPPVGTPWTPQDIADFVADRSGLSPGDVSAAAAAPRSPFLPLITLGVVGALCALGWQLYQAPFMRWPPLYMAGALVVMWFSVSGGMYNIIRGVPFVGVDRRTGQAQVFMDGSGQFGAEGFLLGSSYLVSGLLVAALTRVLPQVKDAEQRRVAGWVVLVLLWGCINFVTGMHAGKTGMRSFYYF